MIYFDLTGFQFIQKVMYMDNPAWSYKTDPSVPDFSDDGPRTIMDAQCSLCARGARWIARNDHKNEFRIIPLQSELGSALMRHYGMDPGDPLSWLYLEDGLAYSSIDAFIRVGKRLGGVWNLLIILRAVPPVIQNYFYNLIARNRYQWFGQTDMCSLPNPEIQKRILS